MLNRLLLEPSECEVVGETLVAQLPANDRRTKHMRTHIKAATGDSVRAGLLDAGTTDSARLKWVEEEEEEGGESSGADAVAGATAGVALRLELGPAATLLRPLADSERPRLDVLLAMPRPLQFGRLLPMVSSMGIGTLWVTGAKRADLNYFSSHLLRDDNAAELRAALVMGLEQSGETAVPRVHLRRSLPKLVRNELAQLVSASPTPVIKLVCHPERKADGAEGAARPRPISAVLSEVPPDARVLLAIGPERGWEEPAELDMFAAEGFEAVTLGPRTLRTDVATISLLAIANEQLRVGALRAPRAAE